MGEDRRPPQAHRALEGRPDEDRNILVVCLGLEIAARRWVDDWRAMVDSVMIDSAYDGVVFDVTLTDVPARKADFVAGRYDMPAPGGETTVAVKIIDMLGEEVVVTQLA